MKKEWFEPGPDGVSPFEREYLNSDGNALTITRISAAFRALLAGEAVPVDADAKDAEIAELRESLERSRLALNTTRQQRDQFWSQRDAARAELERWKSRADAHEQNYKAMLRRVDEVVAERDALQARVDAGVRVWGSWSVFAVFGGESSRDSSDTHTALLIDARPIADADERKGERRKVIPARIRRDGFDYSMDYDTPWMTNRRKYDRRRTAGTIADRGKPCTPA